MPQYMTNKVAMRELWWLVMWLDQEEKKQQLTWGSSTRSWLLSMAIEDPVKSRT
jgi:hypothetical protein